MNLFDSIQGIPGNTSNEKQAWIAAEIKSKVMTGLSLDDIVESEKFPNSLKPLIKIEAAKILIRMGRKDLKHFEAITEGLRSEDIELVNRSLTLKEFFDGLNEVLDVKYFLEDLFPFVAYNTRGKIIKKLARSLKNSDIAEEFFEVLRCTYGLNVALPLLIACSEIFVKKAMIEHRIVLTNQMINDFYEKYPQLVIWYLRLSDLKLYNPAERFNPYINLSHYRYFLGKLFKNHLNDFIEIYENGDNGFGLELTNRQSKYFAKHAKKYYLENPKVFYKMLKSENVYYKDMEVMFPKMLPEEKNHFSTSTMLKHLIYYPKSKKSALLLLAYKSKYGVDLLDDERNVTEELVNLLPTEQRVQQARIKIQKEIEKSGHDRSEWKCYLPTGEVLPKLYELLLKTPDTTERTRVIAQMLRCCEINEDLDALYELFVHVRDKHRNEVPLFQHAFINNVTRLLDTLCFSTKYWVVLLEIAQRMFVKADVSDFRRMSLEFLEGALKFKFENDQPADGVFEMMHFVLTSGYHWQQWNFFPENMEYQRLTISRLNSLIKPCLEMEKWDRIREFTVTNLLRSMYAFNEKAKLSVEKVEPLVKSDFQWLFDELEKVVQYDSNYYYLIDLKVLIKKNDIDLFYKFWPNTSHSIDVKSLNLLKSDPKSILQNWEEYFEKCEQEYKSLAVKGFMKELRWHKEIRTKFVDRCIANINKHRNGRLLFLLALLTDGKSFGEFLEPLLPTETKIEITGLDAKERFSFLNQIAPAMKRSNPPVDLELIEKLCEGDYLASALSALANSCRKTELKKAIQFAEHLSNQRVSVAKHGVRLMSLLESSTKISKFLSSLWKQQEHYSIRTAIFAEAQLLFERNKNSETWSLIKMIISSISEKEILLLNPWPFNLKEMSNEHVIECLQLLFNTVDKLEKSGDQRADSYACRLFDSIDLPICNILPEEFLAQLLKKYLFDEMRGESAKRFLVSTYFQNSAMLEERLSTFSSIFTETVKNEWNLTKVKNYPIKSAVRSLITGIVYAEMGTEMRLPVIRRVFHVFQSVLTNFDDAKSYLLLNFAFEWAQVETVKGFSESLAKNLIDLFALYTPWFNSYIVETLKDFLTQANFDGLKNDDVIFEVINSLIEFDLIEVLHTAVQLLKLFNKQFDDEYQSTIERLSSKSDHPAVKALLNSFCLHE